MVSIICVAVFIGHSIILSVSRYSSPTEAFSHSFIFHKVNLKKLLEGQSTAMAIYEDNGELTSRILEKDEKGWKTLPRNVSAPKKSAEYDELSINIRNHSGMDVISITDLDATRTEKPEITDSMGTKFQSFSVQWKEYSFNFWYAELEKLEDDYTLYVGDNEVKFDSE